MKPDESDLKPDRSPVLFGYLTGVLTATIIFLIICGWIVYGIGFSNVVKNFNHTVFPWVKQKVVDLPAPILQELITLSAGIENADNPTNLTPHDTIFVSPDKELGHKIKPNVKVSANILKTTKAFNFDPPVLFHRNDADLSDDLKAFIKAQSRHQFSYTSDSEGFRRTLPIINADKAVLIIGDSVAFGVGVDDKFTVASSLQKRLADRYRVINASVGGYNGQQAFKAARQLSHKYDFEGLIYVACQNDYHGAKDWISEARDVLAKIKSISNRFDHNVIIIFQTYMEYNLRDIFLYDGWSKKKIDKTHQLRQAMPELCKNNDFVYYDWSDMVEDYRVQEKSFLSGFALYADHVHLSPLGNRLLAEKLFDIIDSEWQTTE
jgi:lysophospholipase L1-like esterase